MWLRLNGFGQRYSASNNPGEKPSSTPLPPLLALQFSRTNFAAQLPVRASASRAHARGYSAVLSSLLFFRHLVGLARSSTESSTRLRFGSNLPHPRSRAIVLPVSTFHHRQASLLPLTYRAKVSLQRTLYSATFQLSGIYISSTRCLTVTEVQRVGILQHVSAWSCSTSTNFAARSKFPQCSQSFNLTSLTASAISYIPARLPFVFRAIIIDSFDLMTVLSLTRANMAVGWVSRSILVIKHSAPGRHVFVRRFRKALEGLGKNHSLPNIRIPLVLGRSTLSLKSFVNS